MFPAACLRFEIAIPIPDDDPESKALVLLSFIFSTIISLIILILVYLFPDVIVAWFDKPEIKPYLYLVPFGVFTASIYNVCQYWATRKKEFKAIAKTRVQQSLFGVSAQIVLGIFIQSPLGLLVGHIINKGAGIFSLFKNLLKDDLRHIRRIGYSDFKAVLKKYDKYPKYSTLEVLANNSGIQVPMLLIASYSLGPEIGFLMLAMRTMQAPIGLLGGAVSQVFFSNAPERHREGTLGKLTFKTLDGLVKVGVGPLLFVGILAPEIFSFVFGNDWARTGELVSWMIPWFVFQFIASPISMVMHVKNEQKKLLALTVYGFILRMSFVVLAIIYYPSFISESYAISGAFYYAACVVVFVSVAGIKIKELLFIFKSNYLFILAWVFIGVCFKYILINGSY